jgi:hypothetical protein
MSDKLESFLFIRENCEQAAALKCCSVGRGIPCRILSSDGPYLHLRVQIQHGAKLEGEILLPHSSVLLILRDVPDKMLGFAAEVEVQQAQHPAAHPSA